MKIAFITSKFPRYGGTFDQREINGFRNTGADIQVFPIYPQEKKAFYDPIILSTLEGKKPYWDKTHHINGFSLDYILGIMKLIVNSCSSRELIVAYKQYLRQGMPSLVKFLYSVSKAFSWAPLSNDYDHVVSFWGNYTGTVGYFMARRSKLPFSIYLHAGTDLYRDRAFLLEKLLFSHRIITVCQFNVRFLKQVYPNHFDKFSKKIIVHHLGLSLERYDPTPIQIEKKIFKVCCIGALNKYKGSLNILRSFHHFINAGNFGEIIYCGMGNLLYDLKKYCHKHNLSDYVIFKGVCSSDEVNRTLQESHILVHGSPYIGDAVPTVIKEAMAMARPVIASNVAGIPELVEDGRSGILVEPGNIEAMTDAMIYLNKNRDLCMKMGLEGRKIAEVKFDLWRNTSLLVDQLQN